MSGYSFSIVTYDRGERWDDPNKKKPYHWAFFLQTGNSEGVGHAYQLRGMPGAFYYSGEESVDLSRSGSKNGQLEVGFVPVEKHERFKQLLEACRLTMLSLRHGIVRAGVLRPWIGSEQKVWLQRITPTM